MRAVTEDLRYRQKALAVLDGADWAATETGTGRLRRPVEVFQGLWVEGNMSAANTIAHVRQFLAGSGVPLSSVEVEYNDGRTAVSHSKPMEPEPNGVSAKRELHTEQEKHFKRTTEAPHMISEIENNLAELLEAEFPNGVRPGDFIDQRRMRRLYREYFDADLPEDFDFETELSCVGVAQGNKVFPRPSVKDSGWLKALEQIVARTQGPLRCSRVMELHGAELMRLGVPSAEVLRSLVADTGTFAVDGDFFAPPGGTLSVAEAVHSVIAPDALLVDTAALATRFPYLEQADIEDVFRDDPDCVRNGPGTFAFASRVEFDDAEVAGAIRDFADAFRRDYFFSLAHLSLPESAAMNASELSDGGLRRAFFRCFLATMDVGLELKGQIVRFEGMQTDAAAPLRAFLRGRAETTLAEIEAVAKEHNIFISKALDTALEETVRVERERFVSADLVDFDIEATDEAIAARCNDVVPLGVFVSFADFPAVPGYVWNACLMESYLRRASRRFRLLCHSSAAKEPVGAVVRRDAPFSDAPSAFAAAALAAGIAPKPDAVGNFLVTSRCALRRGRELIAAVVAWMLETERKAR